MLRDLDQEFCSRFVDELLLQDKKARVIASPLIRARAMMGPCQGEGNENFFKYSLLGHVYILLQIILEEAKKMILAVNINQCERKFEEILSRPAIYSRINCFPHEISAIKLVSTARSCFRKFKNDYKIGSLLHLVEWRCKKSDIDSDRCQLPKPEDYKILIDETNAFHPCATQSMQQNFENLSKHLKAILRIFDTRNKESSEDSIEHADRPLFDEGILNLATQYDLPIIVSIDESLDNGNATVSVCIVIPDMRQVDNVWNGNIEHVKSY
jgi:hypothetical protein